MAVHDLLYRLWMTTGGIFSFNFITRGTCHEMITYDSRWLFFVSLHGGCIATGLRIEAFSEPHHYLGPAILLFDSFHLGRLSPFSNCQKVFVFPSQRR